MGTGELFPGGRQTATLPAFGGVGKPRDALVLMCALNATPE